MMDNLDVSGGVGGASSSERVRGVSIVKAIVFGTGTTCKIYLRLEKSTTFLNFGTVF